MLDGSCQTRLVRFGGTFARMSTPHSPGEPDSLSSKTANLNRGGRPKGTPNRTTQAFRETVQALLDDNRENVALWLKQTAEGSRNRKVGGKTIPGRPPADGRHTQGSLRHGAARCSGRQGLAHGPEAQRPRRRAFAFRHW